MDKQVEIDFREFGLNNPTVIQVRKGDEFIRYEMVGMSVEQISQKVKGLVSFLGIKNPKYTTSPINYNTITRKTLCCPTKSVWERFKENGITIKG